MDEWWTFSRPKGVETSTGWDTGWDLWAVRPRSVRPREWIRRGESLAEWVGVGAGSAGAPAVALRAGSAPEGLVPEPAAALRARAVPEGPAPHVKPARAAPAPLQAAAPAPDLPAFAPRSPRAAAAGSRAEPESPAGARRRRYRPAHRAADRRTDPWGRPAWVCSCQAPGRHPDAPHPRGRAGPARARPEAAGPWCARRRG